MLGVTTTLSTLCKPQTSRAATNDRRSVRVLSHTSSDGVPTAAPLANTTGKGNDCRMAQAQGTIDRRTALLTSLTSFSLLVAAPSYAAGNEAVTSGLDRYIKKKASGSIDSFVPQLLEAKGQLVRVGRVMLNNPDEARQMLREGVFKSIRRNIKAVGDYVGETKGPEEGTKLVTTFFAALEKLDGELLVQSRTPEPTLDAAQPLLSNTIAALDVVIDSVPTQAVTTAEKVLQAVENVDEGAAGDVDLNDPELTKLRKLL